jgi:hypothetical protein
MMHSQYKLLNFRDGDWEENVKRIAPDESVLLYPSKLSTRTEFSVAFKTGSSEGLFLTIVGDDGVIPLYYKVFLESTHLHLLFQCFHENFSPVHSRDYPECFLTQICPHVIEEGVWYFLSVIVEPTGLQLTINMMQETRARLSHSKRFSVQCKSSRAPLAPHTEK